MEIFERWPSLNGLLCNVVDTAAAAVFGVLEIQLQLSLPRISTTQISVARASGKNSEEDRSSCPLLWIVSSDAL